VGGGGGGGRRWEGVGVGGGGGRGKWGGGEEVGGGRGRRRVYTHLHRVLPSHPLDLLRHLLRQIFQLGSGSRFVMTSSPPDDREG
jgi:hypothetical protein